jgi:hypothetical protein
MGAPEKASLTIDLGPRQYQASMTAFQNLLETADLKKIHFFRICLRTPKGATVDLQIRALNAYLVGFRGEDQWYSFNDESGAWGPSCGVGSNYSELGKVGKITYDDLNDLGNLAAFRQGRDKVDKRLIAILIAVVCEAVRFNAVATRFTGLTNSVGTEYSHLLTVAHGMSQTTFEDLKSEYFNRWEKPPTGEMEPGKVYHHHGTAGVMFKHRS